MIKSLASRRFARQPNRRPVPALMPESERESWRRLPLQGARNFRDLGGYLTGDGARLKWGVIYRADGLHNLTGSDLVYLTRLGIRTVVDFREQYEFERSPDRLPDGVRHVALPITVGGEDVRQEIVRAIKEATDLDLSDFLVDVGQKLVTEHTPVYRTWLRELADNELAVPHVFHCSAGKDRTGFAAGLLLRILGVPFDTVLHDYEKSNVFLERFFRSVLRRVRIFSLFRRDGNVLIPMFIADPRYLETSFATIDREWGDFARYVADGLGLSTGDVDRLRARLLERVPAESGLA